MTSDPKRLFDEDPGIAHLIAASDEDAPPSAQMEKLLALANESATTSRPAWRWTRPTIVVGIAALGASIFGVSVGAGAFDSIERVIALAAPSPDVPRLSGETLPDRGAAPTGEPRKASQVAASTDHAPASGPVMTVKVEDLAPAAAPPSSSSSSNAYRARGPEAPAEDAKTSGIAPALERHDATPLAHEGHATNDDAAPSNVGRSTFDQELALVSTARSALQRGDVGACMRAAEEYRARFGAGTFAQEIEVIRIEGLFKAGERAKGRTAAEDFLAANAASPYADRVRSLIERSAR